MPVSGLARTVHEAQRMRQAGDLDGALSVLAGLDTATGTPGEARWAYSEWLDIVRRRFGDTEAMVYSQGTGRAAALVPNDGGALEVVAVLGMRWELGKAVSRRSLQGLRPLVGGGAWSRKGEARVCDHPGPTPSRVCYKTPSCYKTP